MKKKNKKILITGGAGFIGSHLADHFASKGYQIKILDNLSPIIHKKRQWPDYIINKGYELIKGDVRIKKDWEKSLKDVSFVIHAAAHQDQRPDFHKFFDVNTTGAALMYETIINKKLPVQKIILTSTQFVYGDGKYQDAKTGKIFLAPRRSIKQLEQKEWDIVSPSGVVADLIPFKENQRMNPPNSYSLSKMAMEKLGLYFSKSHRIPITILRLSVVQGARQSPYNLYSGALRIFVTQALSKKPITVYEDGLQLRDFINIKDVIKAYDLVLNNPETDYQIYNVGGEKGYRVLDFAQLVKKITQSKTPIITNGFRPTDSRHAVSDINKIKKMGWSPIYQPQNSIQEYVSWYLKFIKQK